VPDNPGPAEPGSGQVEWVDLGDISGVDSVEQPGRRRSKLVPGLLVGLVVIALVVAVVDRDGGKPPDAVRPTPSPTATTSPPDAAPTTPVTSPAEPVVQRVSPKILGITDGWQLFGLGPGALVHVEFAAGRITTTGVPAIQSSGPVSLVIGVDRAIIRPLDEVPAYFVVDGTPAAPLRGVLAQANVILPGPDLEHIWRQVGSGSPPTTLGLATLDGTLVGGRFTTPANAESPLGPDGAGYFYFIGVGGVYDVRGGTLNRVTNGSAIAVGPTRWVAVECDDAYRCSTVTIDIGTGTRRVIGGPRSPNVPYGSVAPDGSVAALYQVGTSGGISLQLLDLRSGQARFVDVQIDQDLIDGTSVWAPDSSRLFVVDTSHHVQVVDPATGQVRPLGLNLSLVTQLAIR
jgi:hypothetical protein